MRELFAPRLTKPRKPGCAASLRTPGDCYTPLLHCVPDRSENCPSAGRDATPPDSPDTDTALHCRLARSTVVSWVPVYPCGRPLPLTFRSLHLQVPPTLAHSLPVSLLHLELRYDCTMYVRPRRPCICLLGTPLCQCHTTSLRSRLYAVPRCLDSSSQCWRILPRLTTTKKNFAALTVPPYLSVMSARHTVTLQRTPHTLPLRSVYLPRGPHNRS